MRYISSLFFFGFLGILVSAGSFSPSYSSYTSFSDRFSLSPILQKGFSLILPSSIPILEKDPLEKELWVDIYRYQEKRGKISLVLTEKIFFSPHRLPLILEEILREPTPEEKKMGILNSFPQKKKKYQIFLKGRTLYILFPPSFIQDIPLPLWKKQIEQIAKSFFSLPFIEKIFISSPPFSREIMRGSLL